jgi:molecular chaperone IbpA
MAHTTDIARLFDQLESFSVGFGPIFKDLQVTNTYPPHNIISPSDNMFYIELAIAGFKKDEITIEEHQGCLSITGNKADNSVADALYRHRGIARRSFTKNFRIAEYFEVTDAKLEDGILTITFVKNIPDEAKPKVINIK